MRFHTPSNKGFTLVELLVVVAIIGILSSIVYVSFSQARKQSRDDVRQTDLKQLQLAVELYKAQNGVYPAGGCNMHANGNAWAAPGNFTTGAAYESGTSGTQSNCDEYIVGLVPDYIGALPTNFQSITDRGYRYAVNQARDNYKILEHAGVEAKQIASPDDDFARCPSSCFGTSGGGYCRSSSYTHQDSVYAVYSPGATCW